MHAGKLTVHVCSLIEFVCLLIEIAFTSARFLVEYYWVNVSSFSAYKKSEAAPKTR